jgi:hypothetical protein
MAVTGAVWARVGRAASAAAGDRPDDTGAAAPAGAGAVSGAADRSAGPGAVAASAVVVAAGGAGVPKVSGKLVVPWRSASVRDRTSLPSRPR